MPDTAPSPQPGFAQVAVPLPLDQDFTYRVDPEHPVEPGRVVRVPFGRRTLIGVVRAVTTEAPPRALKPITEVLPDPYVVGDTLRALSAWVAEYYACSEGEALGLCVPPRPGTTSRKVPWVDADGELPTPGPEPTGPQAEALERLRPDVAAGRFRSSLLHGVTGSGKTEVYLRLIEAALAAGRGALVLLPEIALTPQTLRRVRERFPGLVAPYHSKLSHGERCAVWEAAAEGRIRVVVGARSAVFVPMRDLGLIVVDEEHEPSYKADDRPRIHARDVALVRGRLAGAPVVMGSATPSLESWANADAGKHLRVTLPARVGADGLPEVEIVAHETPGEPLGPALQGAVEAVLDAGQQAILFLNRRGFARYMQCRECGDVVECPNCDISLTFHLGDHRLHCHYCDLRMAVPTGCGGCGGEVFRPRGFGTQRVEVALQGRFPQARILRLDQDTTGRKTAHADILRAFGRGEADILLGTQMVAKGLHFPGVTLVGVIDADAGLHFPDFRAHERAFQLLTQVAGRSGRTGPGRVLLQTLDPDHRVLTYARTHDVAGFLAEELLQREALQYPPARRLVSITATAPEEELLDRALEALGRRLQEMVADSGVVVVGPARAALGRINRRYRGQVLLKGALSREAKQRIQGLLRGLSESLKGGRKLEWGIDVDPLQLL